MQLASSKGPFPGIGKAWYGRFGPLRAGHPWRVASTAGRSPGRTPWASLGTKIRAPFRKAILTLSAEDLLRHEPLWLRSQAPTSCQQLAQCPLVGARQHPGVAFEHRVLRDSLTSLSAAWRRSARASDLPLELRSKLWKRPRAEIGLGRTRLNTLAAHRRSQARAHSPPGAYLSPDLFRGSRTRCRGTHQWRMRLRGLVPLFRQRFHRVLVQVSIIA